MPKLGVMLFIPQTSLDRGMNTRDLATILRAVADTVDGGSLEGDYTHDKTGVQIKIRTQDLRKTGTRK